MNLTNELPKYQIQRMAWVDQITTRTQQEQDRQALGQILGLVVLGIALTACLMVMA